MASHSAYVEAYTTEHVNTSLPNSLGVNNIVTYPHILNGTNTDKPAVPNYKPKSEVDVIIIGAGPVGLTVASSLLRQGVTVRILDKSLHPLIVGRADSLQPRTMEEVFALGPRIEHTVVYKDGKKQIFAESHQSPGVESRYQGLHDATQTEVEHVFIRDLIRHDVLVERPCTATSYKFDEDADPSVTHPITVNITNQQTGVEEVVKARFMVGSDGAHSMIRKSLPISFDGIKTDLHWGIVDAVFDTDFPHRWTFGTVLSSEHGEALVQLNKIFAPYYLKYASPVDWYTILTINERVASTFTYKDRIFLAGDSCHVHSAKGAFGMNTGIMDAHNLAWKLAMLVKGIAKPGLLDTYDQERRENATRAVRTSARYLRFVGNCTFQNLDGSDQKDIDETRSDNLINVSVDPAVKGIRSGYRAPDPRFTILVFASDFVGAIEPKLKALDRYLATPKSFYNTFNSTDLFKIVLVVRATPTVAEDRVAAYPFLSNTATTVYDDQLPPGIFGADAHSLYGASHEDGAVVVVRPDTFVGTAVPIAKAAHLEGWGKTIV
ncbi:FAD binding domain-containing protein [Cyathus striatus]|nr:FAD binding domain-containing protein [Cyathus striatus]